MNDQQADKMWRARVLTIFPDMFPGPLGVSLTGQALNRGLWSLDAVDIRSFAEDKHASVDDVPPSLDARRRRNIGGHQFSSGLPRPQT